MLFCHKTKYSMCECDSPAKQNLLMVTFRVIFNSLCHGKNSALPFYWDQNTPTWFEGGGPWRMRIIGETSSKLPLTPVSMCCCLWRLTATVFSWHSDLSLQPKRLSVCPLLAQQAALPLYSYKEYMSAPSWFLMHMSFFGSENKCFAYERLFMVFKKTCNRGVAKNIFYWMDFNDT